MTETLSATVEIREELGQIFGKFGGGRGDLIPVLQEIQSVFGYVPQEAMRETARFLNIPSSVVYGVVTFYAQFYLTPQGKHKIKVCLGTACHVRHGGRIMEVFEKKLGIVSGETTEDLMFSLERVACFGSCALGPVIVVDGKVHGKMTPERAEELLEGLS